MSNDLTLRPATAEDRPRIVEIYNHYITETPITFDTTPFTVDTRRPWFEQYADTGRHRLIVAEQGGIVLGYTASTRYSDRAAYDTTVETTILCAPEAIGKGVGRLLYAALFEALATEDVHTAMARVTLPNRGSHDIHLRFGFHEMGTLREAGRKFDQYWDVAFYQKMLRA